MRKILRTSIAVATIVCSSNAYAFSTYTIENIGVPYEVLEGVCVYQEAKGFSFKTDPIEGAIQGAFEQMEARAASLGADALVGFDIDFANRTQKDEGRVVLCGTLVKFKRD